MARIRIGIDYGQSPLRIAWFSGQIIKFAVFQGSKGLSSNSPLPLLDAEVADTLNDASKMVRGYFDADDFEGVVVAVPNSISPLNQFIINKTVLQTYKKLYDIINEHIAVAYAYEEIEKPKERKRLAIVSATDKRIDISIVCELKLEAQQVHPEFVDLDKEEEKEKVADILSNLFSSNSDLKEASVDEVVLVGVASRVEKLKEKAKELFKVETVWSPEGVHPEDYAAIGAAVLASKGKEAVDLADDDDGEEREDADKPQDCLLRSHCLLSEYNKSLGSVNASFYIVYV